MSPLLAALFYLISGAVNSDAPMEQSEFLIHQDDTLYLSCPEAENLKCQWYLILPEKKAYELPADLTPATISYSTKKIVSGANKINAGTFIDHPGTCYFACIPGDSLLPDTFSESIPLHKKYPHKMIQVAVRTDNTYMGYLSELMNTPFLLPPLLMASCGHQTDLRAGSDCAELVIYGKRRQGYDVPYCGPMHIYKYMDTVQGNKISPGCIIHFGEQVAVLYEDLGSPGILDKDDLLIQSYTNGAEIVSWEKSMFYNRKYVVLNWKKEYLP